MNRPPVVIFTTIVLDAVGIGLIFPILPSLLKDVTHRLIDDLASGYVDQIGAGSVPADKLEGDSGVVVEYRRLGLGRE
jgi:hypothetical protein